jgi:hypothetical protein
MIWNFKNKRHFPKYIGYLAPLEEYISYKDQQTEHTKTSGYGEEVSEMLSSLKLQCEESRKEVAELIKVIKELQLKNK